MDEQLSQQGSMEWAGIVFGGKFNKNDAKRYLQELRTKLDISTVLLQESSTILASGDPVIVSAWADCMNRRGGLSMRFEAKTPTKALLILEWYAYPVDVGVSPDTKLRDNIPIPKDVSVVQGKECLNKGNPLRNRVACSVSLEFSSGDRDLLLVANVTHGTASAYLPKRRVLVAEREKWQPQPGEQGTVQVYSFSEPARSKSVCLSPKKDWSFVDATMEARAQYISGESESWRCTGEISSRSPSFLCFNSFMRPGAASDNRCNATLEGEIIRWNLVDGLGLKAGASLTQYEMLGLSEPDLQLTSDPNVQFEKQRQENMRVEQ
jgi:hypothetical protein